MTAGTWAGRHLANDDDSRVHRLAVPLDAGEARFGFAQETLASPDTRSAYQAAASAISADAARRISFQPRRADSRVRACASASAVVIVSTVPALTASIRATTSAAHASSASAPSRAN